MRPYFHAWWLVLLLLLAGCDNFLVGKEGLIRDRSGEYEQAASIEPLKLPQGMEARPRHSVLEVPEIGSAAVEPEGEFSVPRPSFFYAETGNRRVNLAREPAGDGQSRLILVEEPLDAVREKVREFWAYNDIELAREVPEQGIMETQWIPDPATEPGFLSSLLARMAVTSTDGRYYDRVRILLQETESGDKTAIRLRHLRSRKKAEAPEWDNESEDISYKSEIMYDLLRFLGKQSDAASARAYARSQQEGARAYLGRNARGLPVLKLTADVDTAWKLLDDALRASAIDLGSSNRRVGKFYITHVAPQVEEQDTGFSSIGEFFSWLHGEREDVTLDTDGLSAALGMSTDAKDPEIRYSSRSASAAQAGLTEQERRQASDGYKIWLGDRVIYVFGGTDPEESLRKDEATGEILSRRPYQLQLLRRSSGVFVRVLTAEGEPASGPAAEDLLWTLKEHLPLS